MAKKVVKTVKKKVAKPAVKAKKTVSKASKPAAKPSTKPAAKPAKPKPAPPKPAPAPKPAVKPAPKAVTKPAPVKAQEPKKPIQAAKPAEPAKKLPAPPVEKAVPAAKQAKPAPLPPIDTSNLPKLPKGIVLKRQKGKLAPGEKRIVKTDVITHHIIADRALEAEKKQKPEPPGKFVMEYLLHTPVSLLYDFLTTPNGLAEWFADGVDMKNETYTFEWDGVKQDAVIVSAKLDNYIRLRWLDKPEGSFFEFKVEQDELTNEVSLIVTDFGDGPDDIATSRHLWETQIHRLMKALGSY